MRREKKTRHLNIFLIKDSIKNFDDVINQNKCNAPINVSISDEIIGLLYIKNSFRDAPRWFDLFSESVDKAIIGNINSVSAVFLINYLSKIYALAFGQGGRFLLKDDCFEERFGLIVALNSIDKNSFRCIDKQTFDTIQSHSRIQSIRKSNPYQFGIDIEQDILRAIVGTPKIASLGSSMAGSDSLVVSVKADLIDLPNLLSIYKSKFDDDGYKQDYPWVNYISEIKPKSSLIEELDNFLIEKLQNKYLKNIWLSIPEIIQWDYVKGFIYSCGHNQLYPDINLNGFYQTIHKDEEITIKLLKTRKVWCADEDHNQVQNQWHIYKCLYAEIEIDNEKYILSGGKWFNIDGDFVRKTNDLFDKISYSNLNLPSYNGKSETKYNEIIGKKFSKKFALMDDKKTIFHGGGSGQVEFCDLFSIDKELIHIKKYGQSSVFSHLFAQGFVSGKLLQLDSNFRSKVIQKLPKSHKGLIDVKLRPKEGEYTIVYGIISDSSGEKLRLPFFSRVNLNNVNRELIGMGFKVQLLKISVNKEYARTKIAPERKYRTNVNKY